MKVVTESSSWSRDVGLRLESETSHEAALLNLIGTGGYSLSSLSSYESASSPADKPCTNLAIRLKISQAPTANPPMAAKTVVFEPPSDR